MNEKFLRVLLLLALFASLGLTASSYVECADGSPDEWLDLLGLTQSNTVLKIILTTQPAAFLDLVSDDPIFQCRHSEILFLQPLALESIFSVTLRC